MYTIVKIYDVQFDTIETAREYIVTNILPTLNTKNLNLWFIDVMDTGTLKNSIDWNMLATTMIHCIDITEY